MKSNKIIIKLMSRNHPHVEMHIQLKEHCADYIHLSHNIEHGFNTLNVSTNTCLIHCEYTKFFFEDISWHSECW
jgi:hypothetical protein